MKFEDEEYFNLSFFFFLLLAWTNTYFFCILFFLCVLLSILNQLSLKELKNCSRKFSQFCFYFSFCVCMQQNIKKRLLKAKIEEKTSLDNLKKSHSEIVLEWVDCKFKWEPFLSLKFQVLPFLSSCCSLFYFWLLIYPSLICFLWENEKLLRAENLLKVVIFCIFCNKPTILENRINEN